ncbi:MAG: hypothetical protein HY060_14960 [Proteobacteria bacterium]|nr:hypothetical protein [Pseudomonadota bacterium]
MRLILYPTSGIKPVIRPAPVTRPWMDEAPLAFAYRCLPLNIANAHGWEVLCPSAFEAIWNGGPRPADVQIQSLDTAGWPGLAHFGVGVITFHLGYLMRTEPGYDLWVGGPANAPKDGIIALTGIVETDWAPYTFTMNWRFTRPNVKVRFERGEPFCSFFPIPRELLEQVTPEIRDLDADPEMQAGFKAWTEKRGQFLADLPRAGSDAQRQGWQKDYFRGLTPDGRKPLDSHRTRVQLNQPIDKTKAGGG